MKKATKGWLREGSTLGIVIAIIILFNVVLSFFFVRWDLTQDKRYSLSPVTVDYLKNNAAFNKTRVHLKIYLEGELPADIKIIRNSIQEKIDEFIIHSGDKITYEFIDPDGTDDEKFNQELKEQIHAKSKGVWPCDIEMIESGEMSLKTIWPGAELIVNGEIKERIHFFTPGRTYTTNDLKSIADKAINDLEFTLISNIKKVVQPQKKKVAFLQGHGELSARATEYVRTGLKSTYDVEDITIDEKIDALRGIDALVIAQPKTRFSEKDKFIIDQFIMTGGSVAWFIDMMQVEKDSLYYRGKTFGLSQPINLEDQLFKYGVRINPDLIIDKECSPIYVPGHPKGVLPWYFYPLIKPMVDHPITKNIDPVKTEYVSSIDLVGKDEIKKTVLLKSSTNSGRYGTPVRIDYRMVDNVPNFEQNKNHQGYNVGVLLEGKFESLYKNRLSPELDNTADFSFKENSSDKGKMLIVADGDVIRNEIDSIFSKDKWLYRPFPLEYDADELRQINAKGGSGGLKYIYGNLNFFLNAIDYMIDEDNLLEVRAKSISLRLLDKEKIKTERGYWKTINLFLPLFLIVLLGFFMFVKRKKRFAQ